MELNDVLQEFLFECEVRNYCKRTIQSYKNCNILFQNYLKQQLKIEKLEEVKGIHIKRYFKFLLQKKLKPTYINNRLKTIRAFLKYCMKEEYLKDNPTEKVAWQKEGKVTKKGKCQLVHF